MKVGYMPLLALFLGLCASMISLSASADSSDLIDNAAMNAPLMADDDDDDGKKASLNLSDEGASDSWRRGRGWGGRGWYGRGYGRGYGWGGYYGGFYPYSYAYPYYNAYPYSVYPYGLAY